MGNISILKRNEEIELAKRLEEGKEIIKGISYSTAFIQENRSEFRWKRRRGPE